jgi:hypothetical protein
MWPMPTSGCATARNGGPVPEQFLRELADNLATLHDETPDCIIKGGRATADWLRHCLPDHISDADAGYITLALGQVLYEMLIRHGASAHSTVAMIAEAGVELTRADREAV